LDLEVLLLNRMFPTGLSIFLTLRKLF